MQCNRALFEIPYPSVDANGKRRPATFAKQAVAAKAKALGAQCLRLGSKNFKIIVRSIRHKRSAANREGNAQRVARLDAMEKELWREARLAVKAPRGQPPFRLQPIEWARLLALVPPLNWQANTTRAQRRRQALVYQGLWRTARQAAERKTLWASPAVKRRLNEKDGGRLVYQAHSKRCPPRRLDVNTAMQRYQAVTRARTIREWKFSPYKLDYYERCAAPNRDVTSWLPQARLRQSLIQRGRSR